MIYEELNIWKNCDCKIRTDATLRAYIPDNFSEIDLERKHRAVLICPGGAYRMVSEREGEPVALEFLSKGIAAFVLNYSVAPAKYPTALLEASRAIWLIRENADKWHIDTDNIAIGGFSAGGHLAASVGTMWNEEFIAKELGMPEGMNKPNKLILCYPVLISDEGRCHKGSFVNLLGDGLSQEEYDKFSLDKRVGAHTPPTFIWHTYNDNGVPVDSSLEFSLALRKNDIPFEMHIYPSGPHGISLGDRRVYADKSLENADKKVLADIKYVSNWIDHCTKWMKEA